MAHQPIPVATPAQSCPGNQNLLFKPTSASEPIPSRVTMAVPCSRAGRQMEQAAGHRPQPLQRMCYLALYCKYYSHGR